MWFFYNFRTITTISIPQYLKNIEYLCFTEPTFSTCLFSLCSDGLGLGRLQQQQTFPFQYFCPLLGNFTQETTIEQFLHLWTRHGRESHRQWNAVVTVGCSFSKQGVINMVPECDHYIAISKHKWSPLANMSHPYIIMILINGYNLLLLLFFFSYLYPRNLLRSMLTWSYVNTFNLK